MLDGLLQQVKNAVFNDPNTPYHEGNQGGPGGLISQLEGLFGQHQQAMGNQQYQGNPNNGQFGDVKPASMDPYGDPADQEGGRFGNVLPASQDPYGDPADQGR